MLAKILRQNCARFTTFSNSKSFSSSPAHLFHLYQPCTQKELINPPNLIVLHGVLGSSKNFRGITHSQKIASKVDTYLLDMRNHGKSEHRDSMSYTEMADDVYNFILEHKLDNRPNILLGHSMGARTAMEVSARYPHVVQGAIIVDLAPYNYHEDANFNFIDLMENQMESLTKIDITKEIHQVKKDIINVAMSKEIGEVIATNLIPDGHGGYMWRINIEAIYKNFRSQILHTEYLGDDKYYGHARIILGAESEYTSPEVVTSFLNVFPNLDLQNDVYVIKGAGHWVHYSKPHEFIDLVSEFLDKALD